MEVVYKLNSCCPFLSSSCFHLLLVGRWAGAWAGGLVGRRVGVHAHMCGWAQAGAGRKAGVLHACMCLFKPFSNTFQTFFEPLYMLCEPKPTAAGSSCLTDGAWDLSSDVQLGLAGNTSGYPFV